MAPQVPSAKRLTGAALAGALLVLAVLHLWPARAMADDTVRVVTFGTSLTASGGWQRGLQRKLRACWSNDVRVINRAAGGRNSTWGLANVASVTAAAPQIVIVEFAMNDAVKTPPIGIDIARSRRQTMALVEAIRSARPSARIFLLITHQVRGDAVRERPRLNDYYRMYRELAAEGIAGLIDTSEAWAKVPDGDIPDGVHPTQAAQLAVTVPAIVRAIAPHCR